MRIILLLNILILSQFTNAQYARESVAYEELLKYKIDENRFDFGWLPDSYRITPCFRDYTKNKTKKQILYSILLQSLRKMDWKLFQL